jgi:hypothetical protein
MKTDDLITMLSTGPDVAAPRRTGHNIAMLAAGFLLSVGLMRLTLGVLPNLAQAAHWPAFWLKVAFVLALLLTGWNAARRLGVPGARTVTLPMLIAAPLLLMWTVGAISIVLAAPDARPQLFWGQTWRYCPLLIAMLSLPVLAPVLWIMRSMAPTRLRLAGAAAGFAAGAAGATVYCLHCPEMSPGFVGFWYVLGILAPTAIGAVIGRRILAW